MAKRNCSIDGCERQHDAKGFCRAHYARWKKRGDTAALVIRHKGGVEQRFWAKVEKTETCWNWKAGTSVGYGKFGDGNGKVIFAHRFAYELLIGPIPDKAEVDHRCHNRLCVNPEHLRLATRKQNAENHQGAQSNNKSGIRGVWWSNRDQRWIAEVHHDGKRVYNRSFRSREEAETAAITNRNQFHTFNDYDRSH